MCAAPRLRDSVADYPFDPRRFEALTERLRSGALDPATNRLTAVPEPMRTPAIDLAAPSDGERARLTALGREALAAGRVASLIMAGGMATRFGGGAKGVVPVVADRPDISFFAVKLADIARRARDAGGPVPAVVMTSFATDADVRAHLGDIDWGGVRPDDRYLFTQSILPRVGPDGVALGEAPAGTPLADTQLYAAPGHGDTLRRFRESGVLDALRSRNVEAVLVSNVDNLGASMDPLVVGAHIEAARSGAAMTVEIVRREPGDAGAVIGHLPDRSEGRAVVIEAFRLPAAADPEAYPHFNTNNLWFQLDAIDREIELEWYAVRKNVDLGGGEPEPVVQFEQLIGQAAERLPAAYAEVDRDSRFLPIKTRPDLETFAAPLRAFAEQAGLV